jgi:hypothetical protein
MNSQGFDSKAGWRFYADSAPNACVQNIFTELSAGAEASHMRSAVAKDSQNDPEIPARSPHRAACMAGAPFADND